MYRLRPIRPKNLTAQFERQPAAVKKGMRDAAEAVKLDFELTTQGWKHKVTFTITEVGDTDLAVGTDDEIWKWVDEGTKPHDIVARNGALLRIPTGGAAKTIPGRLTSGAGARGSVIIFRKRVRHPGTKARRFTQEIQKRWTRGVQPFIRAAIEEVLDG